MAPSMRAELQERREAAEQNRVLVDASEAAQISVNSALAIVGLVITAVVGLTVLAALAPTFFDSVGDLAENFTDPDLDNDPATTSTAESISATVFPLVISLVGLFSLAGLAFAALKLRK